MATIDNDLDQENNLDQEDQLSSWQKFWRKIAILNLSDEKKAEVAQKMVDYSYADTLYWLQLILSAIIATLGLLINSPAVVIGAMLISPILQPIQSFTFAVNSGHKMMYVRSLNNLVLSVIITVFVAWLVTWLVPFSSLTSQIIARTSPTFIDLFIALAWWVIAMLALWYTRLSDTLAGVAMAAALLPPLCVVGIWIAFLRSDIAEWSTLLFLANLVALVLVGLLILYMFWFFPTDKRSQTLSLSRFLMIVITVFLVAVPLWTSMQVIAEDFRTTQTVRNVSRDYVQTIHPQITITDLSYDDRQWTVRVNLSLQSPEWVRFTSEDRTALSKRLFSALRQSVELDVQIVYVAGAYVRSTINPISDKELSIREHFPLLFSGSRLEAVSVQESDDLVSVSLVFVTHLDPDDVRYYLEVRQSVLLKYWSMPVVFDVEVSYIDVISL